MQFLFGSGVFWGTPLTDANGNSIANPTPIKLGVMQDISLDISFDTKMLYGQSQFPVAVGRGKGKMSGKSKFGQVYGSALDKLFFGQPSGVTAAIATIYNDLTGSLIPASPYTVTPTPPSSGVYSYDLGVITGTGFATPGVAMTRVASAPTTGQYSLSAGVYTFAAADTTKQVFISYGYTGTSTTAQSATVTNLLMGQAPFFKGDLLVPYAGKSLRFTIPQCLATKLTTATKQDDFSIPEFDFEGFADSSGNALYWSTSE